MAVVTTMRRATTSDIPRMCRTATIAFANDPLMRWFFPEPDVYWAQGPVAFAHLAMRSVAQQCTFTTDDGVAIGIFFPPGRPNVDVDLPADASPPTPEQAARFEAITATLGAQAPEEAHWYLNVLATHPDWQRLGLGAAIIEPIGIVCQQEGLPLYLETESTQNVAYYNHLGFRVRSEWDVPLDGPHMWGMIRDP